MKRIIVFLLAVCFAVPAAFAFDGNFSHTKPAGEFWRTTAAPLTGTVKTADGQPVKGARLTVTSETLTEPISALSNGFGIYTFSGLPDGAYTIKASAKGFTFEEESQTFNASGEAVELNFTATAAPEAAKPQ